MRRGRRLVGGRPALVEGLPEAAILLLLRERPSYGYDLAVALRARGLIGQPLPPARVYEALRRLERDGAVQSNTEPSPSGPERRRYMLTTAGEHRLGRWVEALRWAGRSVDTFMTIFESQRKEVSEMAHGCGCGGGCGCRQNWEPLRSEVRTDVRPQDEERGPETLEERVERLEAELQRLRAHA
jgi:PadR family transcriptional regulator PadR